MTDPRRAYLAALFASEPPGTADELLAQPAVLQAFEKMEAGLRSHWYLRPEALTGSAPPSGMPAPMSSLPPASPEPEAPVIDSPEATTIDEPVDEVPAFAQAGEPGPDLQADDRHESWHNDLASGPTAEPEPLAEPLPAEPANDAEPPFEPEPRPHLMAAEPAVEAPETAPAVAASPRPAVAAPQPPAAPLVPPPVLRKSPPIHFKMKNARQGEPYDDVITWSPDIAPVRLLSVGIPPELGLAVTTQTMRVQGTPAQSGEFSFPVQFRFRTDPVEAVRDGQITLFVNADPKSLWKNIPSDHTAPMWKTDEARQMLQTADRMLVAARQRGRSHAHVGSCCDDDFYIDHQLSDDWYVAIVADGAGSASASRRGSYVASRAAGHRLRELLGGPAGAEVIAAAEALVVLDGAHDEAAHVRMQRSLYQVVGYAAHAAVKALHDEVPKWPEQVRTVKDLSTTLLIGIARKVGPQWLCSAYWVGDGAAGVYSRGEFVHLLGEVDSGEYSGQTRFLDASEVSAESLLRRTRYCLVDDFTAFILMTDGVSDAKFATEAQLGQVAAWDALWDDLQAGADLDARDAETDARLLAWLDFWSQGNHDDRTIALLY